MTKKTKRSMLATPAPPRPPPDAPVVVHTNTRHPRCPPGLITLTGLMCSRTKRCSSVGGRRLSFAPAKPCLASSRPDQPRVAAFEEPKLQTPLRWKRLPVMVATNARHLGAPPVRWRFTVHLTIRLANQPRANVCLSSSRPALRGGRDEVLHQLVTAINEIGRESRLG
jgi:hypothetical protein